MNACARFDTHSPRPPATCAQLQQQQQQASRSWNRPEHAVGARQTFPSVLARGRPEFETGKPCLLCVLRRWRRGLNLESASPARGGRDRLIAVRAFRRHGVRDPAGRLQPGRREPNPHIILLGLWYKNYWASAQRFNLTRRDRLQSWLALIWHPRAGTPIVRFEFRAKIFRNFGAHENLQLRDSAQIRDEISNGTT